MAHLAITALCCAALLLLPPCARGQTDEVDADEPAMQLSNLPDGICTAAAAEAASAASPGVGPVAAAAAAAPAAAAAAAAGSVLPDFRDPTSYFICCGGATTARATCRYLKDVGAVYQTLAAAYFDQGSGECLNIPAYFTPLSFNTSTSPDLGPELRARYNATAPVATPFAAFVCDGIAADAAGAAAGASAARAPADGDGPGAADAAAAPAEAAAAAAGNPAVVGTWRFVNSSSGKSSTGVVGVHTVLLPFSDQVLLFARVWSNPDPRLTSPVDNATEASTVFNTLDGSFEVKRVRTMPFCGAHTIMPDDSVFVASGDIPGNKVPRAPKGHVSGLNRVRLFTAGPGGSWTAGQWQDLSTKLAEERWYPSQALMPDGNRVLICGGSHSQQNSTAQRSCEVYDHSKRRMVSFQRPLVMARLASYIYYPVISPLPYGLGYAPNDTLVLIFNCDRGGVVRLAPNNTIIQHRDISWTLWPTQGFCGAYSSSGSMLQLMLDPANGYAPEYANFGGYGRNASQCNCVKPASKYAHRIRLDSKTLSQSSFKWEREVMPGPRTMNDAVLLPDGKVLLVNGAKTGVMATTRNPVFNPWLYDPAAPNGTRFTVMAPSTIYRLYHSNAVLLPDASVLVLGSSEHECPAGCTGGKGPLMQTQAERFLPPYFSSPDRPVITGVSPVNTTYGAWVTVDFTGNVTHAVLLAPSSPTHQVNMHQKGVRLMTALSGATRVRVRMPPNALVAFPGSYMLFVLNGGAPCTRAAWVRLRLQG